VLGPVIYLNVNLIKAVVTTMPILVEGAQHAGTGDLYQNEIKDDAYLVVRNSIIRDRIRI
jgi:hypothetical protein